MSWETAVLVYGIVLFCTLAGGVAIGTAMGLVGIIAVTWASGIALWPSLGDILWNTTNSFTLVAVPLFVLMGEIILRSGMSKRFYAGLSHLLVRVPGGLAQSNIMGCAVFAAISGSSTATALTIGTVALPEMRERGYHDRITLGTLAGGGCLGILIPPSIPMVIYASVVQESVIDLFMAGVVPGLMLAALFMLYVAVRPVLSPSLMPRERIAVSGAQLLHALANCVPVALLMAAVLGGMYFGVVTPTEAAAFGSAFALLLALLYRELTWQGLSTALRNAVVTSCVVMFIIINSQILSFAVVQSGIGRGVADLLINSGLDPLAFFCLLFVLYLLMGMFIDGISMMLLTVPVLYPAMMTMGFDGIWFGVVLMVLIELGQVTPPMGLNLFAVQSIAVGVPLGEVAKAALPYAVITAAFCFVLYAAPELALWLPQTMAR